MGLTLIRVRVVVFGQDSQGITKSHISIEN